MAGALTDWAELNEDLLHLIAKKLPDITDVLRMVRVCRRWSRAFPEFCLSFPWILQFRHGFEPEVHFFSLYYNKIYTFNLGEQKSGSPIFMSYPAKNFLNLSPSNSTQISASFDSSPTIARNSSHSIAPLHPINRSQIKIPPRPREFYRVAMMEEYNKKTGECGIFLENILYEHKAGRLDKKKDWIFTDEVYNGNGCAYFKGKYFTDSQTEGTKIIDVKNGEILCKIPPSEIENSTKGFTCLIESTSKDLIKVFRPYDVNLEFEKIYFEIYRLVMNDNEQPFWVEIKSIKDEMFFLDYSPQGLALNAGEFAGLKGNCIYFMKGEMLENEGEKELGFIVCRYDLMDGKIEKLNYPLNKWGTWVIPFIG